MRSFNILSALILAALPYCSSADSAKDFPRGLLDASPEQRTCKSLISAGVYKALKKTPHSEWRCQYTEEGENKIYYLTSSYFVYSENPDGKGIGAAFDVFSIVEDRPEKVLAFFPLRQDDRGVFRGNIIVSTCRMLNPYLLAPQMAWQSFARLNLNQIPQIDETSREQIIDIIGQAQPIVRQMCSSPD